jgi:hypothetical protein
MWKYNFQEEKSAHINNKVNLKTQNKNSSLDKCPDYYKYKYGSVHLYNQTILLLECALGNCSSSSSSLVISGFWFSWRVCPTWGRIFLVALGGFSYALPQEELR